jgi:hypothetical protein
VRAVYPAMELTARFVIVPLAFAVLGAAKNGAIIGSLGRSQ